MDLALDLLAVIALTLGTAFFVGVEFALVAVNRSTIESMAEEGNRRAASTLKALKALSFELSGAQLGITVTSITVGYIAEPLLARGLEPAVEGFGLPDGTALGVSLTLALILATTIQMVLGELVPKNLAIARPVQSALVLGPMGRVVNALFKPLIFVLNGAANWTVRRLGIEPADELEMVRSLEEIEHLIHSSRDEGFLRQEEFSLLTRSITFAGKTAADALVPRTRLVGLPREATLADIAKQSLEDGHSRYPVYAENLDDILGIALVKDIYAFPPEQRNSVSITEIVQDAPVVPESRDLESLLLDLRGQRKQMAIVVDEYGGTAGIITIEDLLEEIVGDIEDEYDVGEGARVTEPPIEGVHVVSGMLHPDEVRDATGLSIPEGDYETLAGFLLSLFGRIPSKGEHVSYGGWELKIVEMERNRIDRVLVVAPTQDAVDDDEDDS